MKYTFDNNGNQIAAESYRDNKIYSPNTAYYTYFADGLRTNKTVNGVEICYGKL